MAVHTGRGIAAIEYPTGMNQNGDPSQAWIKVKPDGRIDVFAGTSDIGNGSKTIQSQIVAETIGVPYEWITYDNSNTDSSPGLHRHVRIAGDVRGRQGGREGGRERAREDPRDRRQGARDRSGRPRDRRRRGASRRARRRRRSRVPDVAAAATWTYGELITGTGAQLKPYATIVEPGDRRRSTSLPTRRSRTRPARPRSRSTTRPASSRVTRLWQCYDVGKSINPTLVEGQIEGGAIQGLGLGVLENCYPYYPSAEHRGGEFGAYLTPGMEDMPQIDTIIIENPSSDGPYGAKGIGEMANNAQPPAIAAAVYDAVGVWVTELPITPERVLRALEAKAGGAGEPSARARRSSSTRSCP